MSDVISYDVKDGIAVITSNNPPVNALGQAVRAGLEDGIAKAAADDSVKAVVITCEGRTFFAGADITEFGKPPQAPSLPDVVNKIEASPKPVVAAIHGTALGGGLEVALGCHYRVAVPSAKLGLPEVKLGILPGAGGTQRLPRVVGVEPALEMIVKGDPIPAKKGETTGLVDKIVEEGALLDSALAFAKEIAEKSDHPKVRDRSEKLEEARADMDVFSRFQQKNARRLRGLEAPVACIQAVQAAVELPFEEGMAKERELFTKLVTGDQSKALRHVFFAERMASKIDDLPKGTELLPIKQVGILGAGTMGGGIAMNFLSAGIPVKILEREQAPLERGMGIIRKNYEATAKKGRMTEEQVDNAMSLLSGTLEMEDLGDCDLIIEAVFELMEVKKEIFTKLDAIAKPGAILASNTSYLNIDEIASVTKRPESVVGLHFFSPANVMRLLEVVRGEKTSHAVLATSMDLAKKIKKIAVVAGVCFGFIGNRMLAPRQAQANDLILSGAKPWDVDRVLTEFGFPMGPFQMGDLAGLDLGWTAEKSSSSTIREILCENDRRGQKTSAGFYDYDENRRGSPSEFTEKVIADFMAKHGHEARDVSDEEIKERLLYTMVNEGAKILEEGMAQRASDIDIVWLNGYGWPAWTGGPMFWADQVGLDKILASLKGYEAKYGEAFKPAALLEKLVAEGKTFNG